MLRPSFFSSEVILTRLKFVGKSPSANDKLANLAMIGANMLEQLLRSDVRTKSIGDDLHGISVKIHAASVVSTGRSSSVGPL